MPNVRRSMIHDKAVSTDKIDISTDAADLLDAPSYAAMRELLSLKPGVDVMAYDAGLMSLVAAEAGAGLPYLTGASTWARGSLGDLAVVSGAWQVTQARGLREGGGTTLALGPISDGQALYRSGSGIAGVHVMPDTSRYAVSCWVPSGNGGVSQMGGVAPSVSNGTNGITDSYPGTILRIGAGAASVLTATSAYIARRGHRTKLSIRIVAGPSVADQRLKMGWYNGTLTTAATPGASELWAAFTYDSASDTTWKITQGTGTVLNTNYTVVDTGISVTAGVVYLFEITLGTGGITYTITRDPGGTPTTFTTTVSTMMPSASTGLALMAHLFATTATTREFTFLGGSAFTPLP